MGCVASRLTAFVPDGHRLIQGVIVRTNDNSDCVSRHPVHNQDPEEDVLPIVSIVILPCLGWQPRRLLGGI